MSISEHPTRMVSGVCPHDCPDSCGWLVTVEDRPSGPVPVKLRGNPDHPFSRGELCPKVNRFLERALSPQRVLHPLRRVGPKGAGRFERTTWDDALAEIARRWRDVIATHGPSAIVPFWDSGNQSQLAMGAGERLLTALGASELSGNICGLVAGVGTALTYGNGLADDPAELRYAQTVLLWGTNTRLTNRHLWPFVEEARANGATIVVIDPIRTATAEAADVFVQPLPGTDVALVLAMMHILIRDGLIDRAYLDAHSTSFDELAAHVARWTPARAAAVCGLDVEEIEALARLYGTKRPSFIRTLIGAEHTAQGATFFRALAMLPVLIGAWRERGGGFARSVGSYTEGRLRPIPTDGLGDGRARRALSMTQIGRWLTDPEAAVHALLVWNCNPVISFPNSALIRQGLARDDLFTVVHEQFLTDTAAYADLVLPATTQIEADDVMASWGSPHLTYNHAAVPPLGEAVSNSELFRRLAAALGLEDPRLQESDEALMAGLFPEGAGITLERLRAEGTIDVGVPAPAFPNGGFATADGRAVLASAELEAAGLGRVPDWRPAEEGHGGDSTLASRFPFLLATPKTHWRFLNSSYSHLPGHGDREPGPYVEISAADAASLGINDGETVAVHNDRARLELPAKVSRRVRPGLIAIPWGWHAAAHPDGQAVNALTNDASNHGGGSTYNDTRAALTLLR